MGLFGRLKNSPGGGKAIPTVASASQIYIPDDYSTMYISGTTAITTVRPENVWPGRVVTFIGITATGPAFTNNNDTTTAYQMDLGGSNRTVAPNDVLRLIQKADGTWLMMGFTDN